MPATDAQRTGRRQRPEEKAVEENNRDLSELRDTDRPPYPHIHCRRGTYFTVHWGKAGWAFIFAVLFSLGTTGTYAWRANASEEAVAKIEKNQAITDRNIKRLDEQVRIQASQTGLTVMQLNKLLDLAGVTERIVAPAVEKSEMEDLE